MPDFEFSVPTYIVAKNIHKNQEPILNARWIIDESRIEGGGISDFQFFLSNDGSATWVKQSENSVSVTFSTSGSADVLYGKIVGKAGVNIAISGDKGKAFPVQIRYNEAL